MQRDTHIDIIEHVMKIYGTTYIYIYIYIRASVGGGGVGEWGLGQGII